MAKYKKSSCVLLGYEDEVITDKHLSDVGYWTNKIGGYPDYPPELEKVLSPKCQLCNLSQPLIVQVYAPLENSPFHRTLYLFGCINPNCWNQNESWTCLRCQSYDGSYDPNAVKTASVKSNVEWCTGGESWDDDNGNFENGNVIASTSYPSDNESDDSSSLSAALSNLSVDECNANRGATANTDKDSGAVGKQTSPAATAEIEGDESEVVSIDTPTLPQKDVMALLHESAPVPFRLMSGGKNKGTSFAFISMFMSVGEENMNTSCNSDHIKELIQQYQQHHGDFLKNMRGEGYHHVPEKYEKCYPPHGDKMYHQFLTRIKQNPGHILRYGRETGHPLLLYPLQETLKKCRHCGGDVIFEMQILPTLIPKLHLTDERETHIEFGTVLLYTCKRSCWTITDKFKYETVIVQVENL